MMEERTKKKAASHIVVGATMKQQSQCTDKIVPNLAQENNENPKKYQGLRTISMTELYDTVYPPKKPIVDGFLQAGTYLFVGAPKVGKSFFMAQLGYHVAMGLPLWEHKVHRGKVLYLALEDDYARLQKRLFRMFGVEGTEYLHLATEAKDLATGLDAQLEAFVTAHPEASLIIIDTLQKVRELSGDGYSYAGDYDVMARLKKFSDKHNVCLLVVHHTRKMQSDDSFDMISGTNGLLGAADGAFIVQKKRRTDNEATLDVVGRDQPDQRINLRFDREACIWRYVSTETELWREPVDPLLVIVRDYVDAQGGAWEGTSSELVERLRLPLPANVLTRKLNVLSERLLNDYGIAYKTKRTHEGRSVWMTRVFLPEEDENGDEKVTD